MTTPKQRFPSLASTISVLNIVLYCVGFLRVELELNNQKERLNARLKTWRRALIPNPVIQSSNFNARAMNVFSFYARILEFHAVSKFLFLFFLFFFLFF